MTKLNWSNLTGVGSGLARDLLDNSLMSDVRLAAFKAKFDPKNHKKHPRDQEIHEICCQILQHAETYGDCSKASALLNALPVSRKRAMIAQWFLVYSPIILAVQNLEYRAHLAKEGSIACKPFDIEAAKQNPFYTLTS